MSREVADSMLYYIICSPLTCRLLRRTPHHRLIHSEPEPARQDNSRNNVDGSEASFLLPGTLSARRGEITPFSNSPLSYILPVTTWVFITLNALLEPEFSITAHLA